MQKSIYKKQETNKEYAQWSVVIEVTQVWSAEGSEVKGEVDTLPSFNTDQLSLLLWLCHTGSDGICSRWKLDIKILTGSRHAVLKATNKKILMQWLFFTF